MVVLAGIYLFFTGLPAFAQDPDFDWLKDFNIKLEADPSGFRAQLATRFKLGDQQLNLVLGNVEKPADAYLVLRIAELSQKPPELVLKEYKAGKGKGWGQLAKHMGIKPGSKEFHALQAGADLPMAKDKGKDKGDKGKEKERGKGRN